MGKVKCENCDKMYIDYTLIKCKCNKLLCSKCKYTHTCNYDYYKTNKEILEKKLPKVQAKKI